MKQYKYLYRKIVDDDTIYLAYKKLRKGKTKRHEIRKIDANYDEEAKKIKDILIRFATDETAFTPPKHSPVIIREGTKDRKIYIPDITEQWIHHIIMQVLEPVIMRTQWRYSCGSIPDRGAHYGKKVIERWIKDHKKTKYFLKFDIRHFYGNIRLDVLWSEMSKTIKDELVIKLCRRCLMHFRKGLPLGYYISQWLANFFLTPMDDLITAKYGITCYVRYVDDGTVFCGSKKTLHKLVISIQKLIGSQLRLKLKNNWQICRTEYKGTKGKARGRKLDFMGFLFDRNKTTLRKRLMMAISRKARRFKRKTKWWIKHIRGMISYFGWMTCTDTYSFYLSHVKPYVSFKRLRNILSKHEKRTKRGSVWMIYAQ